MTSKSLHKGKYYVTIKYGFDTFKKHIVISVDKVFESDSLRISLSDDDDPTFLCILNVTRLDYEDLKKQQGLLIDYDNFPSQLIRLLQQCASNNMFIILQQTNPLQLYFEIVEHNEFKRLIHLSLKTGPATDADIKMHMGESISQLKKTLSALKTSSSSTEAVLSDKCINMERKIHDLSHVLTKMEEDKLRKEMEFQEVLKLERDRVVQERLQWQKNSDLHTKAQLTTSQENLNRKNKEIDELNNTCKQLKGNIDQLESQLSDKTQRLSVLETEVQKSHIEVATLKAKNSTLDREIMEKDKQYAQLNSRCSYLEKTLRENSDTIRDLNSSLQLLKKEKTSLEERLSLSETLAKRNNEAANSTSDQLLKANQIISKLNTDLMEMKEKLLCRTAIALEQEKVIESNTKEIEELKIEIHAGRQDMDKIKTELANIKEKYESNENTLKDRDETIKNNNMVIQWLNKKLEENYIPADVLPNKNTAGNRSITSSTPYFLARNNNTTTSQEATDESINFYATSKLSNIDDSQQPQTAPEKSNKIGLDPKYLRPAADANQVNKPLQPGQKCTDTARAISTDSLKHKGKENKEVNLPKVDYREKKSSRPTTYKPTPVSAYFP